MKVTLTSESAAVIMLAYPDGNRAILLTENGENECECCIEAPGVCDPLTEWRIVEAGGKVDPLSGPIAYFAGYYGQMMNNFPQPWGVPHYNGALPLSLSMKLEVKCKGEWKKIDEWVADVGTCGHTADRWPAKEFVVYQPPEPCNCKRDLDGDCGNPPELCPTVAPGTQYYLPNASAYTFTAAVDGEWSNLKNWQDYGFASPARELPNSESVVVIDGVLSTIFPGGVAFVNTVLVTANGQVRIPFQAFHAEVLGIIGVGSSEACGNGVLVMAGPEAAEFKGAGSIEAGAEVIGNAKFRETSHNDGTVTGAAEFYDTTVNSGTVTLDANFHDTSVNHGRVDGNATFDDTSANRGVNGVGKTATFNGESVNWVTLYAVGPDRQNVFFHEDSRNKGRIGTFGFAQFDGNAKNQDSVHDVSFTGYSMNDTDGICLLDATFAGHSHNDGKVTRKGKFFETSYNNTGGTVLVGGEFHENSTNRGSVTGATTFDGSAHNTPGTVTGDATFMGDAANGGTVTGTASFGGTAHNGENAFNGIVTGNATFAQGAYNSGTCSADASFVDQSYNGAGGIVSGNATFGDSSARNDGTVSGNATFIDTAENNNVVGGTATFNGRSNNYGTAAIIICNTLGVCTPFPPPPGGP